MRKPTFHLNQLGGERDDWDPQAVLDNLNIQLLVKSRQEIKVMLTPKTCEWKKKRAENEWKRLTTSINYGGKRGKGKGVKQWEFLVGMLMD